MKDSFAKKGIRTFLREGCTRFSDEMLHRYFHFESIPDDADESNTIYINNFLPFRASDMFYKSDGSVPKEMLNSHFLQQIEEYRHTVFRNRKMLGVLIRGTDYVNLKLTGIRRQATVDEMIPLIDRWIENDGYEKIFLATEDAEVLDRMREKYGNRLLAIAQERFRVDDFRQGQYLSDVEKEHNKDDYEASVEDTTVNYFYALVLLSYCDSFIASGQCNGWDVVCSLNGGHFQKKYRFGMEDEQIS